MSRRSVFEFRVHVWRDWIGQWCTWVEVVCYVCVCVCVWRSGSGLVVFFLTLTLSLSSPALTFSSLSLVLTLLPPRRPLVSGFDVTDHCSLGLSCVGRVTQQREVDHKVELLAESANNQPGEQRVRVRLDVEQEGNNNNNNNNNSNNHSNSQHQH